MNGWESPLLGIRFELIGKDMQLYYPDGRPFESYPEIMKRADRAESELKQRDSQLEQARDELEQERQQCQLLIERLVVFQL